MKLENYLAIPIIKIVSDKNHQWLLFLFCLFVIFVGLYPQHMEVPRLGAESEL